ncbi:hypothetical protein [Symbioplanes lichenis]|uniref:hypothetical protein n=1 Tax=Symbioplanes lichenis TaxID=1629072 RepID=UPI0027386D63|nr:hypothetical protein [Actinoplanes lichenis]
MPLFPLGGGFTDLSGAGLSAVADRHGATVQRIALGAVPIVLRPVDLSACSGTPG